MGQFAQQFKDYEQYDDGDCYRKSVPANLSNALSEVLVSACGQDGEPSTATTMSKVANDLLTMAGKKPTTNWDAGPLKAEITAFVRIKDPESAQRALEPKEPSLGKFENAVAGLIIAEALTLFGAQRSVSALSLLPCESTYFYSFSRALALGYVRDADDPIAAPFGLARKLTRQPARRLGDELLSNTLKVLSGLVADKAPPGGSGRVPAFIWETCRELQSEREVKRSWGLLSDAGVLPEQFLGELRGPREHRVRAFEQILHGPNRLDAMTSSFLAGLLADQIGPGSFEHVDLLLPYLNQYPTALIWYGLCAGLHPDSEIQQIGNCLGRRLVRDLLAPDPIISRPKYDIAVGELEVHLDREEPLEFRTASQNHIAVELLPGVPAFMKWPVNQAADPISPQSRGATGSTRQGGNCR